MKLYLDRKTRKLGKLAVMLMTIPCTSALAAYDYSSALSDSTHFASNLVTIDTVAGAELAAAGTATDANENHIGWSTDPTGAVNLYWNYTGLGFTNTGLAPLIVGHAMTPSATDSSSFNKLTVDSFVNLSVYQISIGQGALGSGDTATVVDATRPANSNALTVSGANYSISTGTILSTKINTSDDVTVGYYGNDNSLEIKTGAKLTANGVLTIGYADKNNLTSGSGNSLTVSGMVDASSIIGYSGDPACSTLDVNKAIVGFYGSGNALKVSDSAILQVTSIDSAESLVVGFHSSENVFDASDDATITLPGSVNIGKMPAATGNTFILEKSELTTGSDENMDLVTVGYYGSKNSLGLNEAKLSTTLFNVGIGDTSASETSPLDGTTGYEVTEGCENRVEAVKAHIVLGAGGTVRVGFRGSQNRLTIVESGIYNTWVDKVPSGATKGDGLVQLDEITNGIDTVSLGYGMNDSTVENAKDFGSSNAIILGQSAIETNNLDIGTYGTDNVLFVAADAQMKINTKIVIGEGDPNNSKLGIANGIMLMGENAEIESAASLSLGKYGSTNGIVAAIAGKAKFTGAITEFGYGKASTAETDNTAFGSENLIGAAMDSSLEIGDGTTDIIVGYYGSGNRLQANSGGTLVVNTPNIILGYDDTTYGSVLDLTHVSSKNNRIDITNGSTFTASGNVIVGYHGVKNSFVVSGEDSYASVANSITIGNGSKDNVVAGSGNVLTVTDSGVLVAGGVTLGGYTTKGLSSDCLLTVSDKGVLVTKQLNATTQYGENNFIRIKSGIIALKGKGPSSKILWSDVIFDGVDKSYDIADYPTASYVDSGLIKVWNYATGDYVTATKADLSLTYYSSEADAKKATGYEGLAGYTILKQANDLSRLEWAGDVYEGGNGSYCSSWYGWFYNDASYGDYIMSYNNYSWEYVDPSSTPQDTYLYDYSLAAWLYTNSTYFENKWVYNYSTKEWMQISK
jgi:hypothetical protein